MEKFLKNKLISNTLIQSLGKIISALIGFSTVFLLTRYLGVDGYGKFTLVFAYLTIFSVLADFGLHLSMIRELTTFKGRKEEIIGTYFTLRFILVILSTIIALLCLLFTPYPSDIKIAILIASISVNIGLISGFSNAIFQSDLRLDLITLFDFIGKITTVICILIFILIKLNFYFIVSTVLIGNSVALALSISFLKKEEKLFIGFNRNIATTLLKMSIPVGITSFFSLLYFKIDILLLSFLKGTSEIAYYGVSYKIFENILVLWGFYMASAYPILSSKIDNIEEFNSFLKKNIKTAIFSSLYLVVIFYFSAPYIIKYLAGDEFLVSVSALKLLLFSIPFFFINNIIYHVFILKNKPWILVKIFFISLIFNIILNVLIIPKYGFIGASAITLITEVLISMMYLYTIFFIKKYEIRKS